MATPLTADQLLTALRAEGLKVIEELGWRTRNRNHKGAWGPVHGVMNHHTVTGPGVNAVPICRDGHSTLPGPLCHVVIKRDGRVYLIANGRANHAGGGDPDVLNAVINESYSSRPPAPDKHDGETGAVDGNARFYGGEYENAGDGKDPWPAAQVEAIVRFNAALIRAHRAKGDDWSEKSAIGHLEWSDWKSDPRGPGFPGMPGLRTRIADRLAHTASWNPDEPTNPTPTPRPTPTTPTEEPMPRRTYLSRPEGYGLAANTPQTLYWTLEHADDPGHHGGGGKTVLTDSTYSGSIHLRFNRQTGATGSAVVTVTPVREAQTGGGISNGPASLIQVDAATDGFTQSVAFTGEVGVGYNLVFVVEASENINLEWAGIYLHSDPA